MLKIVKILIVMCVISMAGRIAAADDFVTVRDGHFMLHGKPYRYVGTNMWYAAILASEGEGGNRDRLARELDSLQAMGIDNLRILAGAEGNRRLPCHIEPTLQKEPGVYDEDLLHGLDYLLCELERRDMRAVLYLTNSWECSGGYGTYLEWAGHEEAPIPARDGYRTYVNYARKFVADSAAKAMYANHVRAIVGRTNSITGKPYAESPAIMSWQICNEPRCFDAARKDEFEKWLVETARLIKSIDNRHLVSTGSEGYNGCEVDIELWARIHASDAIDYANIHIWPYNWSWVKAETLHSELPQAIANTAIYIDQHRAMTRKPLVLEEFGYPRDGMAIAPGSPTAARDDYYRYLLDQFVTTDKLDGLNFWGWGGDIVPAHRTWEPGDDYTGDPAQEDQGLYSVFAKDESTVGLIRRANESLRK